MSFVIISITCYLSRGKSFGIGKLAHIEPTASRNISSFPYWKYDRESQKKSATQNCFSFTNGRIINCLEFLEIRFSLRRNSQARARAPRQRKVKNGKRGTETIDYSANLNSKVVSLHDRNLIYRVAQSFRWLKLNPTVPAVFFITYIRITYTRARGKRREDTEERKKWFLSLYFT